MIIESTDRKLAIGQSSKSKGWLAEVCASILASGGGSGRLGICFGGGDRALMGPSPQRLDLFGASLRERYCRPQSLHKAFRIQRFLACITREHCSLDGSLDLGSRMAL